MLSNKIWNNRCIVKQLLITLNDWPDTTSRYTSCHAQRAGRHVGTRSAISLSVDNFCDQPFAIFAATIASSLIVANTVTTQYDLASWKCK